MNIREAMMALLNFRKKTADTATASANPAQMEAFLQGYSIEVMPRTASKSRISAKSYQPGHASISHISKARPLKKWSKQLRASMPKVLM